MQSLLKTAPAKINLGLEVLVRRPDGFHEINTVFLPVAGLYDTLEFSPASEIQLECTPDLGIRPSENLVYRAALLLKDYAERNDLFKNLLKDPNKSNQTGAKIRVRKHIPSGAGLGGGSSDAATTLLALKELWELPVSDYELHSLATMLGSDVPFFLKGKAAVGRGRGEKLEYFDMALPYWLVVIHPNIHVNTGEAYSALQRSNISKEQTDFKTILMESFLQPELLKESIVNDFEDVVFKKHPEIGVLKENLYKNGAVFALMSGSGSSVFGLFKSRNEAVKATEFFKNYQTFLSEPQP
ncbi:MAG: 4-(cytidine 5'-diphospho)-2-C-methyl-D-erythritol kinase [Bacteroidota bacterium]